MAINYCFTFDDSQLDEGEQKHEFVEGLLTQSIEMLQLLKLTHPLLHSLHFDSQWFHQECILYLFGVRLAGSGQDVGDVVLLENS